MIFAYIHTNVVTNTHKHTTYTHPTPEDSLSYCLKKKKTNLFNLTYLDGWGNKLIAHVLKYLAITHSF